MARGKKSEIETDKELLEWQEMIENSEEVLEVPGFKHVVVKCPKTRDRLEAKRLALKIADGLTEADILEEQARLIALKMIITPEVTLEDYLNGNDAKVSVLLDSVNMWYNMKMKKYNEARKEQIRTFLEVMKEP